MAAAEAARFRAPAGDPKNADHRAYCDSRLHLKDLDRKTSGRIVVQVAGSGFEVYEVVCPLASLWRCECPSRERPCKHVKFVSRLLGREGFLDCPAFCSVCDRRIELVDRRIVKWCPGCVQPMCWNPCFVDRRRTGDERCPRRNCKAPLIELSDLAEEAVYYDGAREVVEEQAEEEQPPARAGRGHRRLGEDND